ncbi:MAG: type II toxin-antitoxin system VapB family antitoxin [Gemmatimonadaceae bacterium]|nr:type II toxin-antitoxin system VapB family antitoxin [Caulobacter sp.]
MAEELAKRTGMSLDGVVTHALRAELERTKPLPPRLSREEMLAAVAEIQARVRALPILDPRTPEDMLYDEDGLPK